MKPVQLMPAGAAVVKEVAPGSGSVVASILIGGVLLLGVAGYFLMAHVSTLKTETTNFNTQATERQNEAAQISQQIADAGSKKDWSDTVVGFESEINEKLGERTDYAVLTAELDNIRPPGTWLTGVNASVPGAGTDSGGSGVALTGYAPSAAAVAALVTRINATESMDEARVSDIKYEKTTDNRVFVQFSITADLAGEDSTGGVTAPIATDPNAQTVGSGSGAGNAELSLEPEPGYDRRTADAAKGAKADEEAAAKPAPKPKPQLTDLEKLVKDANAYGGSSK